MIENQPIGSRTSFDSTAPNQKPDMDDFMVTIEDEDGNQVPYGEDQSAPAPQAGGHDSNLAEDMDEQELMRIGADLYENIENDVRGRSEWEKAYTDGLKLLGLKYEQMTMPWQNSCGVFHPMLLEAVIKFQSETIMETFPAEGPVRAIVLGDETPEKKQAAKRVEADMNYQLTEVMTEYRGEHERMLWNLAVAGSAFKKIYFDPAIGRQVSMFCPAEDVVLPYGTSDLRSAERITHRMRRTQNELRRAVNSGFYRDADIGDPLRGDIDDVQEKKDKQIGYTSTFDERYTLYECACELDLKGYEDVGDDGEPTGIALPYVVTIDKRSQTVLSIYRNWKEGDPFKAQRAHFVQYNYIPGFGPYGFGLTHLIGGYAISATAITRQLVDAGTLSNLPGGLKAKGLRIKGDDTPIAPGEFRDVDVGMGALKDSIMPLPYKEPSTVLFNLLGQMVKEARELASTADLKVSDMSAQAPVGTTLAIIERMLKVMSAVQARVHFTLKQELKLLRDIIRDYTAPQYDFDQDDQTKKGAKKQDYQHTDVIPCSDPNAATMTQRVVQYQAAIQLSQSAPQIYNLPLLHQQMLDTIGVENAQKIVVIPDQQTAVDPVTENMHLLTSTPVRAILSQNHEAHIQVHMAMTQDPKIMQIIGQSPNANAIQSAVQAHLAEHVGMAYRAQIQQIMGKPLPPPDQPLPPQVEAQLSLMVAQAAQQLLQQNQQQAAQQAAQQNAADPLIMQNQQELAIKAGELQRKQQADQQNFLVEQQRLALEREKMARGDHAKGLELGLKHMESHHQRTHDAHTQGFDHGIAIADKHAQRQHEIAHPQPAPTGGGFPPKGN